MNRLGTLVFIGSLLFFSTATLFASYDADNSFRGNRSEFYGTVVQLPDGLYGVWIVDGQQIAVTSLTRIVQEYGLVDIGVNVEVKGTYDGRYFNAYEIEVKPGVRATSSSFSY